jgi:hypothetical protein
MTYLHLTQTAISPLGGGEPFAAVSAANPLRHNPTNIVGASSRIICWSGWLGDDSEQFARDFRTWTKDGWAALDAWCDALIPHAAAAGATICFRPHPRHVLADAQACMSFLKRRESQPVEVLLDPAGFLTGTMLPRAEDHLRRVLDALASHPAVPAILISNVIATEGDPDQLEPSPIGAGLLSPSLIRLIAAALPSGKPRVLVGPDPVAQAAALDSLLATP